MKLGIYCSASENIPKADIELAEEIFSVLAHTNKYELVLGGSSQSLMKKCCEKFKQYNNQTTSVIVKNSYQQDQKQCSDKIYFVKNSSERNKKILQFSDIVLTLFGGIGSICELFNSINMVCEGEIKKPIIIYNQNHHYDKIIEWINEMIISNYIDKKILETYNVVYSKTELMTLLKIYEEEKK